MGTIMLRARVVLVAAFLLGFAVPDAKADPLTIFNESTATITVTLDGGWPFVETVTLAPKTFVTRDVWRIAPQRHVTVIDLTTNTIVVDKFMTIPVGIKVITVRDFPAWDVVYGP